MGLGRDGSEPRVDPVGGMLGQWVMNGFKHGNDMITSTLTIVLETLLWLWCGKWFGEVLGFSNRDTSLEAVVLIWIKDIIGEMD